MLVSDPKNKEKIQELFNKLSTEGYHLFEELIMKMGIDTKTLLPFAKWSDRTYQRVCVAHDDNAELILLCWDKGQGTPIHNHGRQECWVHIVEGEMTETIYKSNSATSVMTKRVIQGGTFTYLTDDIGNHKLENASDKMTMSLHLYANPIKKCDVYDETSKSFISRNLVYDAVL